MITGIKADVSSLTYSPREISPTDDPTGLRSSIKAKGITTPLVVKKEGDGYRIIDGVRRHRIAVELKLARVPITVIEEYEDIYKALRPFDAEPGEHEIPRHTRWRDAYWMWEELSPFGKAWSGQQQSIRMTGRPRETNFAVGGGSGTHRRWSGRLADFLGPIGYQWPYVCRRLLRYEEEMPNSALVRSLIRRFDAMEIKTSAIMQRLNHRPLTAPLNPREEISTIESALNQAEGLVRTLRPFALTGVSETHNPELVQKWATSLRRIQRELIPVIRALEGNHK